MQPEAATLAPFQKRRMPSSCMRIWAVRIEVILVEPIAYKCVYLRKRKIIRVDDFDYNLPWGYQQGIMPNVQLYLQWNLTKIKMISHMTRLDYYLLRLIYLPQTQCLNKLILVVSLSSQSIKSSDIFDGSDGYFIVDI